MLNSPTGHQPSQIVMITSAHHESRPRITVARSRPKPIGTEDLCIVGVRSTQVCTTLALADDPRTEVVWYNRCSLLGNAPTRNQTIHVDHLVQAVVAFPEANWQNVRRVDEGFHQAYHGNVGFVQRIFIDVRRMWEDLLYVREHGRLLEKVVNVVDSDRREQSFRPDKLICQEYTVTGSDEVTLVDDCGATDVDRLFTPVWTSVVDCRYPGELSRLATLSVDRQRNGIVGHCLATNPEETTSVELIFTT